MFYRLIENENGNENFVYSDTVVIKSSRPFRTIAIELNGKLVLLRVT